MMQPSQALMSEDATRGLGATSAVRCNDPEELIEEPQTRAWMSTFQRDELLTQSEILEKETSPLAKEANEHSKAKPGDAKHGQDL